MPSNWSKIRDEWLDRTAVAKDDAKWALEALINSEEELFEIEQKIRNKEDTIRQVKVLKKKVKDIHLICQGLENNGCKITTKPKTMKNSTTVLAFVEDPDGYKIELIERD